MFNTVIPMSALLPRLSADTLVSQRASAGGTHVAYKVAVKTYEISESREQNDKGSQHHLPGRCMTEYLRCENVRNVGT